jgi:hypothetical protein
MSIRTFDPRTEMKDAEEYVRKFQERPMDTYEESIAWVAEQQRLAALPKKKLIGMEEFLKEAEEE